MLVMSSSMRAYFREAMETAIKKTDVTLSDTAQVYVVNLLTEFSRAEAVYAGTDKGEKPVLVDLFSRAQEAEPQEALRLYKHMGDSSLYLSGFFVEAVEKDMVGVDYYVSMGGGAYQAVSELMRPLAATSSALFAELADRFPDLVELLGAISLHQTRDQPLDDSRILELVERYRRTGRKDILEKLKAHGVVMRPFDEDPTVQ